MPTIRNSPNLTLTPQGPQGSTVTVRVTYTVTFSPFEQFLIAQGLRYREIISVLGEDAPVADNERILHYFPVEHLPAGAETIARDRDFDVSRISLDEDFADNLSEIRCRVELQPFGLPRNVEILSDREILPDGLVILPGGGG